MFENFRQFTIAADVRVNGYIGGQGEPLLLLHGYPQNVFEWAEVAPRLAERFTVVCTDLRGYGASGKPEGAGSTYAFATSARDQREVMRQLGFDRFRLIGHDRGARVAYQMALDFPASIEALGLLDIVPTDEVFKRTDAAVALSYWHWYFMQLAHPYPERMIAADPELYFSGFFSSIGKMAAEDLSTPQFEAYRKSWSDPDFIRATCEDYRSNAAAAKGHSDASRPTVSCPALVAWGVDGVIPTHFDIEALWSDRLAQACYREMPGGHYFVDQFPAETAKLILDFL